MRILLSESCKFGEKICYSNKDNEFFLRDCFLLSHPVSTRLLTATNTTSMVWKVEKVQRESNSQLLLSQMVHNCHM